MFLVAATLVFLPVQMKIQKPPPLPPPPSKIDVLTHKYNNGRTGANLAERQLSTYTVNAKSFGKLFSRSVDGQIYAQPLIATGLHFPTQGVHDAVFVATAHNSVFAFDAVNASESTPLWSTNLGPTIPWTDYGVYDVNPEIGIISTPVIDKAANTIFVVAHSKENGSYFVRLHALNLLTGKEMPNSPVTIGATVPGTGEGGDGQNVTFDPFFQMNRPALLLDHGRLYVAFGSHGDTQPYHGWIFVYGEASLAQLAVYCNTPNGVEGGIWMSGNGLVADPSGVVYHMSGNGDFTHDTTGGMTGNSFVKMQYGNGVFAVTDFFTPHDSDIMNDYDVDLGASGPLLIPNTQTLVGAGKDGTMYLVNTANMGKFDPNSDHNMQRFWAFNGIVYSGFVYWNSWDKGPSVYVWPAYDTLKRFQIPSNLANTTPVSQSTISTDGGNPGGSLTLSADGSTYNTGIVWATAANNLNANWQAVPGILYAFDGANLNHILWSSQTNAGRDGVGQLAKFCPPVVANGRVYLATFSNQLLVYGLLNAAPTQAVKVANGS